MIRRLNQTVQGWCNYHRHACSSRIFRWVDSWLFWEIKRWLHRRRPNKGRRWIMNKYYRRIKNSRWNLHAIKTESDGKRSIRDLIKACRIRIVRHVKIRAEANPFDPEYADYFAYLTSRMRNNTVDRFVEECGLL
jgi:RNA-directed DNA polymerase